MKLNQLLLLSTTDCTLRCKYCYMDKSSHHRMTIPVAIKAIDWSLRHVPGPRFSVEFFGGDPLLNLDIIEPTIKYTIERLKRKPEVKRYWFTLFVNGYNKNLSKALEIIKPYKDNTTIQFSMDGCREAQDAGRLRGDGKSVFDEVVRSIELVKKETGRIQIHAVLSPETVRYFNKSVDFLISIGCKHLEFGIDRELGWTDEKRAIFDEELHLLANRFINWMKQDKSVDISLFVNPVHCMIRGKHTGCYVGRTGVLIGHDGAIYPCQRFEKFGERFVMGDIWHGVNQEAVDLWEQVNCYNMIGCRSCPLFEMCLGQCVGASVEYNGSPLKPIKEVCLMYHTLYKESIRIWKECRDYPQYKKQLHRLGLGWGTMRRKENKCQTCLIPQEKV